jgi:hypothetical protein
MSLNSGTGPVPRHYPERGIQLSNGATVLDVNESRGTLLALSPTGAFAVWFFEVTPTETITRSGQYFDDLQDAVDLFTGKVYAVQ